MSIVFKKLVGIEPLRLNEETMAALGQCAEETEFYANMPENNEEIIRRIGNADAFLVSHTTKVDGAVLKACPNLRYVGMCCSLYSPESANVDILAAEKRGIVVKGIRDYGDEGVPEYVISELVRFLHGFYGPMWKDVPTELTEVKCGIIGMGTTGMYIARALKFFGAEISYFSRTRKPDLEEKEGYQFRALDDLLRETDILCTCLTKNTILLNQQEFELFGNGKIIVNTSIGPGHDIPALKKWLDKGNNYFFCDAQRGIDPSGELMAHPHVFSPNQSAGYSIQMIDRLGRKVLENIQQFSHGL